MQPDMSFAKDKLATMERRAMEASYLGDELCRQVAGVLVEYMGGSLSWRWALRKTLELQQGWIRCCRIRGLGPI